MLRCNCQEILCEVRLWVANTARSFSQAVYSPSYDPSMSPSVSEIVPGPSWKLACMLPAAAKDSDTLDCSEARSRGKITSFVCIDRKGVGLEAFRPGYNALRKQGSQCDPPATLLFI